MRVPIFIKIGIPTLFKNLFIVPIPIFGKIGDFYQNSFDALTRKTEFMSLKIQTGVYILWLNGEEDV